MGQRSAMCAANSLHFAVTSSCSIVPALPLTVASSRRVNAKAKNFTREKLRKRFKEIDERIGRYLSELDRADEVQSATGMPVSEAEVRRITDKNGVAQEGVRKVGSDQSRDGSH